MGIIAERITKARKELGLNQKELAKKSKKHISTIQRVESTTAIRGVSYNTVIDIAIALKMPATRFLKNEYPGYKFVLK